MRYVASLAMVVLTAQLGRAQAVPLTVADAEAEGAAFPHGPPQRVVQHMFGGPFGGTSERRCTPSQPDDSIPGSALVAKLHGADVRNIEGVGAKRAIEVKTNRLTRTANSANL